MYEKLIRMDTVKGEEVEILTRVPLGKGVSEGSVSEETLRDLLFRHPQTLPISAIDPAYDGIVSICKELRTSAGYMDTLYANSSGRLVIAEFKLWRNPQARREVIGQILDYAKDLASWGYEDLQRQVSLNLGKTGNVLYELVRKDSPELDEAEFVDNVTRHLKRGEFLLLIVGDGIREDVENIVDFVQGHSGLNFNLALVETALYRDAVDNLFVQPRVLARTEIVQRFVVESGVGPVISADVDDDSEVDGQVTGSDKEQQNLRFWNAVLEDFNFSDVTVDVPIPTKNPILRVKVRNSSLNGRALNFVAYIFRERPQIGCYLSVRKGQMRDIRIFEEVRASLDELQKELGEELEQWEIIDKPVFGFWRKFHPSFLDSGEDDGEFQDAVSWMREHLNRLVSGLHPRLQTMLAGEH